MSKRQKAKQRLEQAEENLVQIEKELGEAIARYEKADSGIDARRDRLENPSDGDMTPARREQLKEDIRKLVADREQAERQKERLRPRRKRAARRVRHWRRVVRNFFKPKVIDLELWKTAVRPLARQTTLNGTVGHYTGGPWARDLEDAIRLWRVYDSQHKGQGWACLGYPWGVAPDGTVVLLRGRQWVGAHTLNCNTGWDGCSVHGTTGDTWTRLQKRGFRWALKKFGTIDKPVKGHRQMPGQATACPGSFEAGYNAKGK